MSRFILNGKDIYGQGFDEAEMDVRFDAKFSEEANNVLGAKNLLPINITTPVANGITFTKNPDGSVTANGTSTQRFNIDLGSIDLVDGERYIASGGKVGGSETTYRALLYGFGHIYDEEITFTFDSTIWPNGTFAIEVCDAGITLDNVTFYPMVRPASVLDSTYVPYAMGNRELTNKSGYTYVDIRDDLQTAIQEVYGSSYTLQFGNLFIYGNGMVSLRARISKPQNGALQTNFTLPESVPSAKMSSSGILYDANSTIGPMLFNANDRTAYPRLKASAASYCDMSIDYVIAE